VKRRLFDSLSLRVKMVLAGIVAVVVPSLVIGGILYGALSRSFLGVSRERTVQAAMDLAILVDSTLKQELYFVSATALDPVITGAAATGRYQEASRKLIAIHDGLPDPNYTYLLTDGRGIVRADAVFLDSIGLDLKDRPYFVAAREGRASIYGPLRARVPTGSNRSSDAVVIAAAPVRIANGFGGVLAAAINISNLQDVVASIRVGRTGSAFLVDAAGLVVVHPDPDLILAMNLATEPGMEALMRRLLRADVGSEGCLFRGTEMIAGFAPTTLAGWRAVVTQDRAEILAPVNGILLIFTVGGLAFFLLTIVVMIAISRRVATPFERTMDLLQRITTQSEDVILIVGTDRLVSFANPVAEKVMGGGTGIVGTRPILANLQQVPDDEIWRELEAGKAWTGVLRVDRPGAPAATYSAIILPVKGRDGAVQSYIEIAKDVTTELTLESRLRQSQKMESLGSLAGGIAHDFNNILGGIFGYSELALSVDGNPEQTREYLGEIFQAAERARDLTRQILMFSRPAAAEPRPIPVQQVVAEALRLVRASTPATIEVRLTLKSGATVMADPTQLHQVVVNLCTNAAAALEGRAGLIDVGLEDRDLDEGAARLYPGLSPGMHAVLRVSDTGKGMEPAVLERIFEPFYTTKPQGKGTGLGLSVVHGIVKALNGAITVRSEPGRGTAFEILIPVARGEADGSDRRAVPPPVTGTERVMVVDDEAAITRTLAMGLAALGYVVSSHTDSGEALEAFRAMPRGYDVLVTDYLMPRMDGFELARGARALAPGLPILICSGFFKRDADADASASGISELLTKPLTARQVAAAIRRVLAARPPA
jgi:signal transduction histidine kinase